MVLKKLFGFIEITGEVVSIVKVKLFAKVVSPSDSIQPTLQLKVPSFERFNNGK